MDSLINCTVLRDSLVPAFRVNLVGAYNVMKAAVECGIRRVIHTGSAPHQPQAQRRLFLRLRRTGRGAPSSRQRPLRSQQVSRRPGGAGVRRATQPRSDHLPLLPLQDQSRRRRRRWQRRRMPCNILGGYGRSLPVRPCELPRHQIPTRCSTSSPTCPTGSSPMPRRSGSSGGHRSSISNGSTRGHDEPRHPCQTHSRTSRVVA